VIYSNQEHAERVWKAIPVDDASYITCADDGLIKIWDLRSRSGSVYTYGGHPGRVSALGIINPHMFVAGSCASDPEQDSEKAQLFFYDRRR
jgi:WD40 repeat protein